jgi:hypothetical protein
MDSLDSALEAGRVDASVARAFQKVHSRLAATGHAIVGAPGVLSRA